MSFAEIFNAYSAKISAENRAKAIAAQPDIPGNVLYTLSSVLEDERKKNALQTPEFDAAFDTEEGEPPAPAPGAAPTQTLSAADLSRVMDGLSLLDQQPEKGVLEAAAPPEEPKAVQPLPPLEPAPAAEEPVEEDTDFPDFSQEEPVLEDMQAPQTSEERTEPLDTTERDDFDLFGEGTEEGGKEADDLDIPFNFNSEIEGAGSIMQASPFENELNIEAPEDLTSNIPVSAPENEMSLPDFSGTEMEIPADEPSLKESLPDGEAPLFVVPDASPRFDLWNKAGSKESEASSSHLDLNEEQIFTIREKINSIRDKSLRFELRNVILEPQYHAAYYDELISMLLVNASEEKIANFLHDVLEKQDSETVAPTSIAKHARATFLADDVENYEQFKEDFTRMAKRVSIAAAGLITLAIILWTTIAQPLRIDNLYRRGLTAIREDKFTEGEGLFNRAQQIAGRPSLKWHLEFGKVYEVKKLVRLAEQKYRAALVIAPKDIPASEQVASFYTNLAPPDFTAALGIFSKLSTVYPRNFGVWDFYGKIYMTQGDMLSNNITGQNESYFNAAGVYRDFIINNINNTAPYYRLLDIYIKLDSIDKIKQIYTLIDQLNPKNYNIEVLSRLAGYYIDRKELTEAERIFRRMIPYIDKNIGQFAKFQKTLERTYNISPKVLSNVLGTAYYEFARYNMLSSDVPRAIRLLTNAMMFSPSNDNVYNLMGEAFMIAPGGTPRIAEAKKNFDIAARLNPSAYKPQVNLGHIYFYYDRELVDVEDAYGKALYHYRMAHNLKPVKEKNFLLNYNFGWLEYRNTNYPDALALWSDIYKDEPANPALSYALGSVFYHMNNPRLSQVEFQKAANSYTLIMDQVGTPSLGNPRHIEVFSQMARVRNNIGVINANYAAANPGQKIRYEKDALLNFYAAKDSADRIRQIYNNAEYNILVLTHPAIGGRAAEFDNTVPKSTTLNNKDLEFKRLILEQV